MKLKLKYNEARDVWSTRQYGKLFVLARNYKASGTDAELEYMIVDKLGKHPNGFIVEPVDHNLHVLVNHAGFECSGSMCRTMADVITAGDGSLPKCITPGRVMHIVDTVDNVNHDWSFPVWDKVELDAIQSDPEYKPENLILHGPESGSSCIAHYRWGWRKLRPNKCYIRRGEARACGLHDLDGLKRAA